MPKPVRARNSVVAGRAAFWYSLIAETDQFAVDPAISPSWVVGRHVDHKSAQRYGGGWSSWWRKTMISRSLERPERTAKRAIDARKRYKILGDDDGVVRVVDRARHRQWSGCGATSMAGF